MKKIILSMTLLLMLLLSCTAFATDRWQWATSTDDISIYIDTETIKYDYDYYNNKPNKNIVKVWVKWVYTQPSIERTIVFRTKNNFDTTGWENLSHDIEYEKINIRNKQYNLLQGTYYDINGNILESFDLRNKQAVTGEEWENYIPDTIGEDVYNAVRKYAFFNDKILSYHSQFN